MKQNYNQKSRAHTAAKRLAFALFLILLVCSFSFCSFAAKRSVYRTRSVSESGYAPIDFKVVSSESNEKNSILRGSSSIPAKYDSRKSKLITPVKDQGDYGACWAFSTMSIAETSLIKQYPKDFSAKKTNLSEAHLAYFAFNKATDKLKLTSGDYTKLYDTSFLDAGGNLFFSTFTLSRWFGVANESVAPYSKAKPSTKYKDSLAYSKNKMLLENAYWIPTKDTTTMKKLIMKYGSCAISYYHNDLFLNTDTGGYFQKFSKYANHSVTIVGWDDNYSKDNFGGIYGLLSSPKKNGAWLVKNSYGDSYADNGYIWLSYEDPSILSDDAVFMDFAKTNKYDRNYQYDGTSAFSSYYSKSKIWMSNTFTSKADEVLKAFSFCSVDSKAAYKYQIYKNVESSKNPTKGDKVFSKYVDCTQPYSGYHTVELPKTVKLKKGEKFSVVVYIYRKNKKVEAICDYSGYIDREGTMYCHTYSKKGQSFLSDDGKTWDDLYYEGFNENLRIKAFTKSIGCAPTTVKITNGSSVKRIPGSTKTIKLKITPSYASNKVTFSSSNPSVAKVNSSGKITAVSYGTAIITAKSAKDKTVKATIKMTVVPEKVSGFKAKSVKTTSYSFTWKANSDATGYIIYQLDKNGKKVCVGETTKNVFKVKGLKPGTKNTYYVVSFVQKKQDGKNVRFKSVVSDAFKIRTKKAA